MSVKTCPNGHRYNKTSDCPVCPVCEKRTKPETGFLSALSAPAKRALENKGISTLEQLSTLSKNEILSLHGIGPSTIPRLSEALKVAGLNFKS